LISCLPLRLVGVVRYCVIAYWVCGTLKVILIKPHGLEEAASFVTTLSVEKMLCYIGDMKVGKVVI
jgi:hypothetical protein